MRFLKIYYFIFILNMFQQLSKMNPNANACKRYYESVINLYHMFYEMLEEKEKVLSVLEKAKELDKYYEEAEGRAPEKYNEVRMLIVADYKNYNPEYGKVSQETKDKLRFTREFVTEELAKEGCELISDYVNVSTTIEYKYKDKVYYVKFGAWRHGKVRPHLGIKSSWVSNGIHCGDQRYW